MLTFAFISAMALFYRYGIRVDNCHTRWCQPGDTPYHAEQCVAIFESPSKAYIVLNNPFCIVKTLNKDQNNYSRYFSEEELDKLYYPLHKGFERTTNEAQKNVVISFLRVSIYRHSAFP